MVFLEMIFSNIGMVESRSLLQKEIISHVMMHGEAATPNVVHPQNHIYIVRQNKLKIIIIRKSNGESLVKKLD